MKRRAAFFALGLIASLIAAGPAAAQASSAPTSVTLRYESPNFVGTVSSPSPECVPGRTVTLFELQTDGSADPVGSTVSGPDGSFSIPQPGADGQYVVTVSARTEGGYGEVDSCEGAQSDIAPAGSGILGGADEDDDDDDDVGAGIDADDGDGAGLPFTGSELASYTLLALGLVGAGALIMRRTRHRHHHRRPLM